MRGASQLPQLAIGAAVLEEAHGCDVCAEFARLRIRRVPFLGTECRASSCVTKRGGGGWCRRCRLMVVTRVTSLDTSQGRMFHR